MTLVGPRVNSYLGNDVNSNSYDDLVQVERNIRKFIAIGSDLETYDVIPTYDKGPTPTSKSFATAFMINQKLIGTGLQQGKQSSDNNYVEWVTYGNIRACYQVEWFREYAQYRGTRFQVWANSQDGREKARELGFAVLYVHPLHRLDELDESEDWEERVQMDLDVSYCAILNTRAERILSADYDIWHEDPEGNITKRTPTAKM